MFLWEDIMADHRQILDMLHRGRNIHCKLMLTKTFTDGYVVANLLLLLLFLGGFELFKPV